MEIVEAIKTIIGIYGKEVLFERKFFNMLADYYSFKEEPAMKNVLKTIFLDGYIHNYININDNKFAQTQILYDANNIYIKYGFQIGLVKEALTTIVESLGISASKEDEGYPTKAQKGEKKTIEELKDLCEYYHKLYEEKPHDFLKDACGVLYSKDKVAVVQIGDDMPYCYEIRYGTQIIADSAFSKESNLHKIIIPDTVTAIGCNAFDSFDIYSDNPKRSELEEVNIPDSVRYIGDMAFEYNFEITNFILGNKVEYLGEGAFACTSIKNITLPASLVYIGPRAFPYDIVINSFSPHFSFKEGVLYKDDHILIDVLEHTNQPSIFVINEAVDEIGEHAFSFTSYCKIHFPSNLKRICRLAFFYCNDLKEIIFPDKLEEIGDRAFENCEKLYSIKFPNSLKYLGREVFQDCKSLYSINLPKNIESIDGNPVLYSSISRITSDSPRFIVINDTLYDWMEKRLICYFGIDNELCVEDGTLVIGEMAFYGNKNLNRVHLPDSLMRIERNAFSESYIKDINLPDSISCLEVNSVAAPIEEVKLPHNLIIKNDSHWVFTSESLKKIYVSKKQFVNLFKLYEYWHSKDLKVFIPKGEKDSFLAMVKEKYTKLEEKPPHNLAYYTKRVIESEDF